MFGDSIAVSADDKVFFHIDSIGGNRFFFVIDQELNIIAKKQ